MLALMSARLRESDRLVPRRQIVAVALGAMAVLSSCGHPTPKRAAKERERVLSTVASAGMVAAAWDSGAVPRIYASHALHGMAVGLAATRASQVWSALPPGPARMMTGALAALDSTTSALGDAVHANDRVMAGALRASLARQGNTLSSVPVDTAAP